MFGSVEALPGPYLTVLTTGSWPSLGRVVPGDRQTAAAREQNVEPVCLLRQDPELRADQD